MNKINYQQHFSYNTPIKTRPRNETTGSVGYNSVNNDDNNSDEYISSEVSAAARAYGINSINQNKTIP